MSAAAQEPIDAFAAPQAGGRLRPHRFSPGPLLPTEVDLAITHCGVCHSDLHLIDDDWGVSAFPLVPGHEIVGTIVRAGDDARGLRIGQRVGVGWLAGSCMKCEQCREGNENLCAQARPTCVGREGGYASRVRVDARFAAPIPDSLPSEIAAPLLCAGITVFAPLSRRCLGKNDRVGVIGLGGLGHLAAQFARAMGCEVTVFSTTASKANEARGFGAGRFIDTSSQGALASEKSTCDYILATVPVDLPWAEFVNVLKPNGVLCVVGASPGELRVPLFGLLEGQKSIGGSAVGSNAEMQQMLEFSAAHAIQPVIELYAMAQINEVIARLRQNQIRYRAVLVNDGKIWS